MAVSTGDYPAPNGARYHKRMLLVIAIITFAGLIGGLANRLREVREGIAVADPEKVKRLDRFAVAAYPYLLGLAAAWCVPLFLSLTQSTLLQNATEKSVDRFIIFGLAVVAALASSRFLDTLSEKVLSAIKKADDANTKAEAAEEKAEEASAIAESATEQPAAQNAASFEVGKTASGLGADERPLLRLFAQYDKWAPSTRGLMRELEWGESRLRAALDSLVTKGLLRKLETTPTRKWVRWTITPNGRAAAAA